MNISIIGTGNMGKALAARLAGTVELTVAGRDAAAVSAFADTLEGVRAAGIDEAIASADIIVLAVPYAAALELAADAALEGKVVVDMSNPVAPDFSGLTLGHTSSAGEEIARQAAGARVVKAFNTIFAQVLALPRAATADVPVFLAGDDGAAIETVGELVRRAGFAVETTGGLDASRLLEPLGMLNIRLGYGLGRGTDIAPGWKALAA